MYTVAVLVERALNDLDADQLVALHEALDDTVTYHLILPVESSSAALASSLSSLGTGEIAPAVAPELVLDAADEVRRQGAEELDASAALLRSRDQVVVPLLTDDDPVDELVRVVREHSADEAIILTEPHFVKEFFGLDWSARAKRALDVPTLHLIEHVPFDGQAR
ncbi:MAG: hypothetical protein P1U38_12225 [Aeromicrobium sp.]|uniref:hypothetical protein n=1 Tax=Aeromicrobium sp. TaxID=1871063 RepID=UPI0025C1AF1A|nr:hypothetical protein [Aeromicrobium sp.]MCK5891184.1 hypothetical protein [Aeromicrobium sp.]MDF1705533.1 hypothetical protein [Aeromicrobium sp.]